MKFLGLLICSVKRKHKHGKRISATAYQGAPGYDYVRFQCPRCGARWDRKVKAT